MTKALQLGKLSIIFVFLLFSRAFKLDSQLERKRAGTRLARRIQWIFKWHRKTICKQHPAILHSALFNLQFNSPDFITQNFWDLIIEFYRHCAKFPANGCECHYAELHKRENELVLGCCIRNFATLPSCPMYK